MELPRLAIVVDDGSQRLQVIATLSDQELLVEAAWRALESAYQRAATQPNAVRAAFQKLDAATLWHILTQYIPELRDEFSSTEGSVQ